MIQKDLNDENMEIKSKAYELYKKHGFKDGNDFVDWLEAERQMGEKSRTKRNKRSRNILFTIVGLLCVIVAILLIMLFTKSPQVEASEKSLPAPKVTVLVLDPNPNEKVVAFGDTYFGFDKSTLSQEAKTVLDSNVQALKDNPAIDVRVAGYTSAMGTAEVNQKLSEDRADSVRTYLIARGIAPARITVIGYGRTRPALYEATPSDANSKAAQANMRVLFEVVVK
jgi:outer membrane protein OmpA-like peptidoglycan-associated protein